MDCFERFGFGEGGREFAALEQQLLVCLRDAPSVGAAVVEGLNMLDGTLDVEADVDGKSSAQQKRAAWARAANPPLSGCLIDIDAPRSWPHVQTVASLPPQRHKLGDISVPISGVGRTPFKPLGRAGAMGLNLRAVRR